MELIDDGLSTIPEAKALLRTSDSTIYRLIEDGQLDARKFGSATRITNASLKSLINSAPKLEIRRHKRIAA